MILPYSDQTITVWVGTEAYIGDEITAKLNRISAEQAVLGRILVSITPHVTSKEGKTSTRGYIALYAKA